MKTLYIDFDSVLNNLETEWCNWVNKVYNAKINSNDILYWDWMKENFPNSDDFWKITEPFDNDIIKPREGALKFLQTMNCYFDIVILTQTWDGLQKSKNEHIQRHFGDYEVIHSNGESKHKFTKDSILIDDKPQTINDHCCKNNRIGIVFDYKGEYGWSKLNYRNVIGTINPKLCVARNFDEAEELVLGYFYL